MPERVLANPLSGKEIIEAVVDKVRQALQRDCYLTPNLAYDFYEADVKVSLTAHDVGRAAKVEVAVHDTQGENEDAALEASDASFHVDAEAPNVVRVESGQPVPVLTKDPDGRPAVRGIKYSKKQLEKAAK
jgi:hypothetical protein